MARLPSPFKYRGIWRAQVTLKNGARPHKDFEKHADANQWITDELASHDSENEPELGGSKAATLAQALLHYAGMYTIVKGGRNAEMDRINHYLQAAGMKAQRFVTTDDKLVMEDKPVKNLPSAFQAHKDARLEKRVETYKMIALLANRRVSTLTTVDFRKFMVCMKTEGLSDSSIQKEIALLKHLFNMAADEWNWQGFDNPCIGLKLKGSNVRFVVITSAQKHALRAALAECDNPYFWPLVEIVVETTLRKGSLLEMSRDNVDLEGRVARLWGKGRWVNIPLSLKTIEILKGLPEHPSGKYFPMTPNAVDMAWDGVRIKIDMPKLQFRDLRHVGATGYARSGMNSHQLMVQLGHTSTRMSDVYCNLVAQYTLDALDRIAKTQTVFEMPPVADGTAEKTLGRNKAQRLVKAFLAKVKEATPEATVDKTAQTDVPNVPMDATALFLQSCSANASASQVMEPAEAISNSSTAPAQIQASQPVPSPLTQSPALPRDMPAHDNPDAQEQHEDLGYSSNAQATGTHDVAGVHQTAEPMAGIGSNVVRVNFQRAR